MLSLLPVMHSRMSASGARNHHKKKLVMSCPLVGMCKTCIKQLSYIQMDTDMDLIEIKIVRCQWCRDGDPEILPHRLESWVWGFGKTPSGDPNQSAGRKPKLEKMCQYPPFRFPTLSSQPEKRCLTHRNGSCRTGKTGKDQNRGGRRKVDPVV